MAVIYVREQGAIVRKHGGRMLVEKQGELLLEIPLRKTDCVSIFGNVQVTTQALSELLDRGIPLALFTRNGRLKGRLVPELSKNTALRLAQYAAALDEGKSLALARPLVRAKLLNSLALVSDYRTHYSSETLAAVADALRRAADEAAAAPSHAVLLGCEGAGAATYFRAIAEMNRSELPFDGREKHPATDPINALLSLGYTLVMNELRGLAEASGLEPHLGFLHKLDYGRPSLALDLLEPFRAAGVDRLTLRLVNERMLTAADFATRAAGPLAGSVVLMPDSFRRYLQYYEEAMTQPRKSAPAGLRAEVRSSVEGLTAFLRDGTAFSPYMETD